MVESVTWSSVERGLSSSSRHNNTTLKSLPTIKWHHFYFADLSDSEFSMNKNVSIVWSKAPSSPGWEGRANIRHLPVPTCSLYDFVCCCSVQMKQLFCLRTGPSVCMVPSPIALLECSEVLQLSVVIAAISQALAMQSALLELHYYFNKTRVPPVSWSMTTTKACD